MPTQEYYLPIDKLGDIAFQYMTAGNEVTNVESQSVMGDNNPVATLAFFMGAIRVTPVTQGDVNATISADAAFGPVTTTISKNFVVHVVPPLATHIVFGSTVLELKN